jgi:hypothetical protein
MLIKVEHVIEYAERLYNTTWELLSDEHRGIAFMNYVMDRASKDIELHKKMARG